MLTLKSRHYTDEDYHALACALTEAIASITEEGHCTDTYMCPTCPRRKACADLIRLEQYVSCEIEIREQYERHSPCV